MKLTRKCSDCQKDVRKDEMVEYASASGKTTKWYCKECYEEKIAREKFANKVCTIFGIASPGPIIWTQRKRLKNTYGYTDDVILDCLDYVYKVLHLKKLSESLVLVNPRNVNNMKAWKATEKAKAGNIAAAISQMNVKEYIAPVKENTRIKKEINLDDALLE